MASCPHRSGSSNFRGWVVSRLARRAVLAGTVFVGGTALQQGDFCDPSLPAPAADPLGYRNRGDRCEGRFIKEVGNTALSLGSLVEFFEPIDRRSSRPLHVVWPVPTGAQSVHLRSQGLKRRLYYRMDTRLPAAGGSYVWPSNLLLAVTQGANDVGMLASTTLRLAGAEREVYLPVRVGYADSPPRADRYELVVVPGVQLSEVFVTLSEVEADGRVRRAVRENEALGYGYYPAERGISIAVPSGSLGARGLYRILVVARLESGGTATAEWWIYHGSKL